MPVARFVRHSPSYLYLKLYSLSLLVTLFASAPVSARLAAASAATRSDHVRWIERVRAVAEEGVRKRSAELRRLAGLSPVAPTTAAETDEGKGQAETGLSPKSEEGRGKVRRQQGHPFPFALKTLATDADTRFPQVALTSVGSRVARVLRRWGRRVKDMSEVRGSVRRDAEDIQRFPELALQAHVRRSAQTHELETRFVEARKRRAADHGHLAAFLAESLPTMNTPIEAADVPTVAVGGSGGGYRATFGFAAALAGLKRAGAWDLVTWLGGVSGSCWTIAGLYTIAGLSPARLLAHYRAVAREGHHPMSRQALDTVARSRRGVYFLLAPLLAKANSGVVGVGIMDLYATMTTCYQLLSRSPHARPRLARSTFQFSRVWQRHSLAAGHAPLPVFSAVRVMHASPSLSDSRNTNDAKHMATDEQDKETAGMRTADIAGLTRGRLNYQWWEATPLEVGSSDARAWIPTWAYGRSFVSGKSVSTAPEISLALLLGQATSAPAGPLTGYISTLLATLPRGTIMSTLLARLNDFVMHRRWEKRWGNPIRGADEPNPLYGIGDDGTWEPKGRIKLMDGGLSNNLPNHIFTTAARQADVIVSFDQSSDVQTGASLLRLADFARERRLLLVPDGDPSPPPPPPPPIRDSDATPTADEIRQRFKGKYVLIFRGWKVKDDQSAGVAPPTAKPAVTGDPDIYLVYCPLLPHPCQPDFDPVTAPFSTSYNLVWTSEQVDTIARTAQANVQDYVVPALKQVLLEAYQANRRRRLRQQV